MSGRHGSSKGGSGGRNAGKRGQATADISETSYGSNERDQTKARENAGVPLDEAGEPPDPKEGVESRGGRNEN